MMLTDYDAGPSSAALLRPTIIAGLTYPAELQRQAPARIEVRRGRTSVWIDQVAQSLSRLARLPDNWDQRGSRAVNIEDVVDALEFLQRVMRDDTLAPSMGPLSSGGIELSWRVDGLDVEAIFDRRRDETVLLVTAGSNESEEPIAAAEKLFADIADRLAASAVAGSPRH